MRYFYTERARHRRVLAITLDGDVLFFVEFLVRSAQICPFGIGVAATLVTANRFCTYHYEQQYTGNTGDSVVRYHFEEVSYRGMFVAWRASPDSHKRMRRRGASRRLIGVVRV